MRFIRGNAAVRDHGPNEKSLILFEQVSKGIVRCIGEAAYLGHHTEQRPDKNGKLREAIIFELELIDDTTTPYVSPLTKSEASPRYWSLPLAEIRRLAAQNASRAETVKMRRTITRIRSEAVRVYVLRRAKGICEACGKPAPFVTKNKRPYLEPHHIHRLADGGPDHPDSVAAVCPNCHKEIHHGADGALLNQRLASRIAVIEGSLSRVTDAAKQGANNNASQKGDKSTRS